MMKKNNTIMQTSRMAKMKTIFQIIIIHIVLILYTFDSNILSEIYIEKFIYYLMILCVAFTSISAVHYIKINLKLFNEKYQCLKKQECKTNNETH